MTGPFVEVCLTPSLLEGIPEQDKLNVVVVDILRATTAMCTAFGYGVASVIPVTGEEEAMRKKQEGWLVAGEREGVRLPFADFGNSPLAFRNFEIRGKDIVFCTTNGTKAISLGKERGRVFLASFVNLEAICRWLKNDQKDVLILCAGWKNQFSLEDSIFAGAMADLLVNAHDFVAGSDATAASVSLWNQSSKNIMKEVSTSSHYMRLLGIENRKGLKYCMYPEKFSVIPALEGDRIIDLAV